MKTMKYLAAVFVAMASGALFAANPILPLWEYIPDGDPYVFEDPDYPGKMRVYLYGLHDTMARGYCGYDYTLWSAPLGDVNKRPGGKVMISEGEYNCLGFENEGLDPFALHAAGIASHYTGPEPARHKGKFTYSGPYPASFRCNGYAARDLYGPDVNRCALVHCTDGSVAGWKYFNFGRTFGKKGLKLSVELEPNGLPGVIDVWAKRPTATEGGIKVGSFTLAPDLPAGVQKVEIPVDALAAVNGREALYLTFSSPVKGQSICTLHTLRFEAERP